MRIDREKLNAIKAEIYYRQNSGHQISMMKALEAFEWGPIHLLLNITYKYNKLDDWMAQSEFNSHHRRRRFPNELNSTQHTIESST